MRLVVALAIVLLMGSVSMGPAADAKGPPKQVMSQEFTIDSMQGSGTIPLQWPKDGWAYLELDYETGAFGGARFSLGKCKQVSPYEGTAVIVAGSGVQTGTTSTGVMYDCGPLAKGPQAIAWTLGTGVLQGRVTVSGQFA